jgi:hypothetical protein
MPGDDAAVELQDLGLQRPQLTAERRKTGASHFREPAVRCIGDDLQKLLNTSAPNRGDNPELGKISSDRVDDGGLLADEEMARSMQHQAALLLDRLGRHKPHVGPRNRFADRLGASIAEVSRYAALIAVA